MEEECSKQTQCSLDILSLRKRLAESIPQKIQCSTNDGEEYDSLGVDYLLIRYRCLSADSNGE